MSERSFEEVFPDPLVFYRLFEGAARPSTALLFLVASQEPWLLHTQAELSGKLITAECLPKSEILYRPAIAKTDLGILCTNGFMVRDITAPYHPNQALPGHINRYLLPQSMVITTTLADLALEAPPDFPWLTLLGAGGHKPVYNQLGPPSERLHLYQEIIFSKNGTIPQSLPGFTLTDPLVKVRYQRVRALQKQGILEIDSSGTARLAEQIAPFIAKIVSRVAILVQDIDDENAHRRAASRARAILGSSAIIHALLLLSGLTPLARGASLKPTSAGRVPRQQPPDPVAAPPTVQPESTVQPPPLEAPSEPDTLYRPDLAQLGDAHQQFGCSPEVFEYMLSMIRITPGEIIHSNDETASLAPAAIGRLQELSRQAGARRVDWDGLQLVAKQHARGSQADVIRALFQIEQEAEMRLTESDAHLYLAATGIDLCLSRETRRKVRKLILGPY